jgi:hypothetical protein
MELINKQIDQEIKCFFDNNHNNVNSVKTLLLSNFIKTKMHHYCWHILHSFSVDYPINPNENEIISTKVFLKDISKYFSYCTSCSSLKINHFFEQYDLNLLVINRENLIVFFIDFHLFISKSLNKIQEKNIYTPNFIIERYTKTNYIDFFNKTYNFNLSTLIFSNNHDQIKLKIFDIQKILMSEIDNYNIKVELLLN